MDISPRRLVIAPQHEGKGRVFSASMLASVTADHLWDGGRTDTEKERPVWMALAGTESELRAFCANLQTGRHAEIAKDHGGRSKDRVEALKSAGYHYAWQRVPDVGAMVTVYLPDLFRIDPGMVDPAGIRFIAMPSQAWVSAQQVDTAGPVAHVRRVGLAGRRDEYGDAADDAYLARLVPMAALVATYLDRRTRCPLVADVRFYLQVLVAALDERLALLPNDDSGDRQWRGDRWRSAFEATGLASVGMATPVAFMTGHERFEAFLADQVARYYRAVR